MSDWSSDVCSSDLGVAVASRALYRPLVECRALVIGGGAIGLLCALTLRAFGCTAVRVAATNALRRDTVAAQGIAVFDPLSDRSEERRVGKEVGRTCRTRRPTDPFKKKQNNN